MSFNPPEQGYSDWQGKALQPASSQMAWHMSTGSMASPHRSENHLPQLPVKPMANSPYAGEGLASPYSPTHSQAIDLKANPRPIPVTELDTDPPIAATSIYFTLNASGNISAVNPDGAAQIGYEAEQLTGLPIVNFLEQQDRDRWQGAFVRSLANQVNPPEVFRFVRRDGNSLPLIVTFQPLQTPIEIALLLVCTEVEALSEVSQSVMPHEQIQAQQILRQQAEWEQLSQAILQPVYQSLELRQILRTVVTEVQQCLQADRVLIYQAHPKETGSVVAEALALGFPSVLKRAKVATLFQQKCFQLESAAPFALVNGIYQTEQSADVATNPVTSPLLQLLGAQSEMVVPILQQENLWGLLIVHLGDRSRQWQAWERGLLKQVGTYLDSLIHQVEQYQKVQRLNADLERQIQARTAELQLASEFEATLKRITDKVRDSLDEHQILETAVQELVYAIGINGCNASIYDLDAGTSTICYEYTTNLSPYQGRVVHLDASPELYRQLLEGQTFQFCSLMINPTRGKVAMLTCPIVDDQGVLGDLWLINQPYYCFTEQDIRLVRQVANQCAIAIRQARLYQAAQAQVKELGRLNRLKDDFLSTVSHELRTPMANIKMATQMLEVTLKQGGLLEGNVPRVGKYFQILQAECQREINLINDLLDLSRLDTEQAAPELVAFNLNTWLPAIVRPFLERAESQQQQLILDLPEPVPSLVADLASLERILAELLQNACKYTPSGETITVSAQLIKADRAGGRGQGAVLKEQQENATNVSASSPLPIPSPTHLLNSPTPYLHLCVTNSGVEIPLHEAPRIFEKFYRIPSSDRWQHGGTGLGLALVRKLAEHLGGSVWTESHPGQTCFTVELPIHLR
jgi:PAS domain S-box-containing protein